IMKSRLRIPGLAVIAALSAGCLVGPNYEKPTLPTPDTIRGADATQTGPSIGDVKWWELFQDQQLQALVRTALAQNYDLQVAAARVRGAEAQRGITRADRYPTVGVEAQAGGVRTAQIGSTPAQTGGALLVGANLTWEIDFWGKFRRANESARAQLLATDWGRRAVLTTIVSEVANAYFGLRSLDLQLDISKRTLTSR